MVAEATNRTSDSIPEAVANAIVKVMEGIDDLVDQFGSEPTDREQSARAAAEVRTMPNRLVVPILASLSSLISDVAVAAAAKAGGQ